MSNSLNGLSQALDQVATSLLYPEGSENKKLYLSFNQKMQQWEATDDVKKECRWVNVLKAVEKAVQGKVPNCEHIYSNQLNPGIWANQELF